MSEIRYGKATFPESCKHLASRMEEPYGGCLEQIWQGTQAQRGASFPAVFCAKMRECLQELPLQKSDAEIFLRPFSDGGFREGSMQLRSLEQSLEQLALRIGECEKEQTEKCRLAVGMGAMSGLLIVILLM